jgi:Viral BACON domain
VTITQSGACSFAVSPTTQAIAPGGDVATVSVTTASGCAWTATESISWITITSGASGTGNGTVSYSVSANTLTSPRTGTLTVGGQTATTTQQNPTPGPGVPSNLRVISKAEQGPSLENRRGGIGAAPATSEHDAPVANGWVATIT